MPYDRARLKNPWRGLNPDQHNHGRNSRNRRGRLHCDAQRAAVGISVGRMRVCHLGHGQQRQQGQAQQRGCPESAWLPASASAKICL
jgi:hypothetical protein